MVQKDQVIEGRFDAVIRFFSSGLRGSVCFAHAKVPRSGAETVASPLWLGAKQFRSPDCFVGWALTSILWGGQNLPGTRCHI